MVKFRQNHKLAREETDCSSDNKAGILQHFSMPHTTQTVI